jgi:hypothetical protein
MLTLHAFLEGPTSSSLDALREELVALFKSDGELAVSNASMPFGLGKYLVFRWPSWSFSTHLESGARVQEDAAIVQSTIAGVFPGCLPSTRVRVVFASDPGKSFTNHIIWVADYLRTLPGAVVYDEAQKSLW